MDGGCMTQPTTLWGHHPKPARGPSAQGSYLPETKWLQAPLSWPRHSWGKRLQKTPESDLPPAGPAPLALPTITKYGSRTQMMVAPNWPFPGGWGVRTEAEGRMTNKGHLVFLKKHFKVHLRLLKTSRIPKEQSIISIVTFAGHQSYVPPASKHTAAATIPACIWPPQTQEAPELSSDTTSHTANKTKHSEVLSQVSYAFTKQCGKTRSVTANLKVSWLKTVFFWFFLHCIALFHDILLFRSYVCLCICFAFIWLPK